MSDERVRQTYRDMATERTPERLDRAVLTEAADAAAPRYSRFMAWSRPMAWAATILLSVAIVLEFTQAPAPEQGPVIEPASTLEADDRGLRRQETDSEVAAPLEASTDAPRDDYRPPAANVGTTLTPTEEQKEAPLRSSAKQQAAPEQASEKREIAYEAEAFSVRDADTIDRAEEMMRMREGAAALPALATSTAAPGCDEAATAAAATWESCIENLEAAGFVDEAERQRELLEAAFPDFIAD